jgi:hypothetical protein
MCDGTVRVGRAVLASCEAFDNFPPRLTGRTIALVGHLPPQMFGLFMQQMRLRGVRRLPIAFGWLTKRGDAMLHPSMGAALPSCCPVGGWSRSTTAPRSSPWTSRRGLPS